MTPEQIAFAVVGATLGSITLFLTVRNWIYGGSVVRVELELGRQDVWHALVTGSVDRWANGDRTSLAQVNLQAVDVVRVVVRNLGRTSATIVDVGLVAGAPPVPNSRFMIKPTQLLGGQALPARIEAHDAKTYLFHAVPLLRVAREHHPNGPIAFRAAVSTGTGKTRTSARWRRGKWNVWVVRGSAEVSIAGESLTTAEYARLWYEQVAHILPPARPLMMKSFIDIGARLADEGAEARTIKNEFDKVAAAVASPRPVSGEDKILLSSLADQLVNRRDGA